MIDAIRIGKFKRRAKFISSQVHLDAAMRQFAPEDQEAVAVEIQPLLPTNANPPLKARKVEPVELIPKDPENLTPHEDTVIRLNTMAAALDAAKAAQKPLLNRIAELEGKAGVNDLIIEALKAQRDQLQEQILKPADV